MKLNCTLLVVLIATLSLSLGVNAQDKKADGKWGHFKGQVLLSGKAPEAKTLKIDKDQKVCLADEKAPKDDSLIVGAGGEMKDVFVMMYRKGTDPKPAVHPSYAAKLNEPVTIDNQKCRFVPKAVFARTGQKIKLINSDEAGHNCHITTFNNEENVNLPPNNSVEIKLENADKAPGNVTCDIHSWMNGVILVREEPYVAITGADGKFTIENIPAGKWKFQFWHKRAGYMRKLEVANYEVGKRRGEIEIEIANGKTVDLGVMKFPADALK